MIWLSSLKVKKSEPYALSSVKTIVCESGKDMAVTLSGNSPGAYAAQWATLAFSRFIQNSTSRDVIG